MIVGQVRGCRLAWSRVRQRLDDQRGPYGVVHAEPGGPDQPAGLELVDLPTALVLESMVVAAGRPDVAVPSGAAVRPVLRVVPIRAVGGRATPRVCARAVADLGTAPERLARAARAALVVPIGALPGSGSRRRGLVRLILVVGLADQVRDELGPTAEALPSCRQPVKIRVLDVQFDDAAPAG